jgi:hypothetical protein
MATEVIKAKVRLAGEDGNAWAIMGRVARGLRKAGNPPEVIDEYQRLATSGDYDNLLRVSMDHVAEPDDEENEPCHFCGSEYHEHGECTEGR